MNISRPLVVFSLAALVAGIVGCTAKKDANPLKTAGSENAMIDAAMAALPKLGTAPTWRVRDLNGVMVNSEQLRGKVVVLDFWATWCGPCRMEIPGYVDLIRKYGKEGLVVVGVSVDQGGPDVVKPFASKMGINYTLAMSDDAIQMAFGGTEILPTTFIIDRAGQIRDRKIGAVEPADYEKRVLAVLKEKV